MAETTHLIAMTIASKLELQGDKAHTIHPIGKISFAPQSKPLKAIIKKLQSHLSQYNEYHSSGKAHNVYIYAILPATEFDPQEVIECRTDTELRNTIQFVKNQAGGRWIGFKKMYLWFFAKQKRTGEPIINAIPQQIARRGASNPSEQARNNQNPNADNPSEEKAINEESKAETDEIQNSIGNSQANTQSNINNDDDSKSSESKRTKQTKEIRKIIAVYGQTGDKDAAIESLKNCLTERNVNKACIIRFKFTIAFGEDAGDYVDWLRIFCIECGRPIKLGHVLGLAAYTSHIVTQHDEIGKALISRLHGIDEGEKKENLTPLPLNWKRAEADIGVNWIKEILPTDLQGTITLTDCSKWSYQYFAKSSNKTKSAYFKNIDTSLQRELTLSVQPQQPSDNE